MIILRCGMKTLRGWMKALDGGGMKYLEGGIKTLGG